MHPLQFVGNELLHEHAKWQHTYFTIQQIGGSYRSINHWDSQKLLVHNRQKSNAWRRFNWYEWVWIELLITLRSWGISLPHILKIKSKIHGLYYTQEAFTLKYFDVCLLQSKWHQKKYYLLLTQQAECEIIDDDMLKNIHQIKKEMLLIPMLPLITKTLAAMQQLTVQPELRLTKKEKELLKYVEDKNYTQILFFYSNRPTLTLYPSSFAAMTQEVTSLLISTHFTKIFLFKLDGEIVILQSHA